MLHSSFLQRLVIVVPLMFVLGGLVSFGVLFHPSVAHAHTFLVNGGARLDVVGCLKPLKAAIVQGYNQKHDFVRWDSSWAKEWKDRPDKHSFETWNWWWEQASTIRIEMTWTDDSGYSTGVWIPGDNTKDPYQFDCTKI